MRVKALQINAPRETREVANHSTLMKFSEQPHTLEDFLFSASFLLTFWDFLVKSSMKIAQQNVESVLHNVISMR